jgi:hypothetical protein
MQPWGDPERRQDLWQLRSCRALPPGRTSAGERSAADGPRRDGSRIDGDSSRARQLGRESLVDAKESSGSSAMRRTTGPKGVVLGRYGPIQSAPIAGRTRSSPSSCGIASSTAGSKEAGRFEVPSSLNVPFGRIACQMKDGGSRTCVIDPTRMSAGVAIPRARASVGASPLGLVISP